LAGPYLARGAVGDKTILEACMSAATLSFTLRIASTMEDLHRACTVRAESYGHHLPACRELFAKPDAVDLESGTAVLICEDKTSGKVVGSARVQTSLRCDLPIERDVQIPASMARQGRAEITRLACVRGADKLVKVALFKGLYLYCHAVQARWMVIGARSPALVRQYESLGFNDLYEDKRMVHLAHTGDVPHRVMAFDVVTAERTWLAAGNALYDFVFSTTHPDINLFGKAFMADRHTEPYRLHAVQEGEAPEALAA
jgi:hypothetical protein